MGPGGRSSRSCCGGGNLFALCLFIGGCVGGVLLGLVGVALVIGRYIGVTTSSCCVDLNGLLLIKVAALTYDLLLLLLLLLIAMIWV
jgi:hypothetical protein